MQPFAPVRRGLTLRDVFTLIAIAGVGLCALIPTLGAMRDDDRIAVSMMNLNVIFQAHMTYAGDFDGRQLTHTPDNLSDILNGGSYPSMYNEDLAPPVPLGFDCAGDYHDVHGGWAIQPFYYRANCTLGNFRAWNCLPFHQYVNGKVYDPTFWAPKDLVPVDLPFIQEWFKLDCAWPDDATAFFFPTYCTSVSAQFDPLAFANDDIGQTHPLDLDFGHRTPTFDQARYPDLKTFMLEHYWLQNRPRDPYIPGEDVQYYFNMGRDSVPVTLFYDGQVRLMPHMEAIISNEFVQMSGAPSLIASTTPGCFPDAGYFEDYAYRGEEVSSYHVFTADGILGRDTIFAIGDGGERRDPE